MSLSATTEIIAPYMAAHGVVSYVTRFAVLLRFSVDPGGKEMRGKNEV